MADASLNDTADFYSGIERSADSHMKVFARLKPGSSCPSIIADDDKVVIQDKNKSMLFSFTKVFHASSTQNHIYKKAIYPSLKQLVRGKNGLILAYGTTCSGKTYSVQGNHDNLGIIPRILYGLFNSHPDLWEHDSKLYPKNQDRLQSILDSEWTLMEYKKQHLLNHVNKLQVANNAEVSEFIENILRKSKKEIANTLNREVKTVTLSSKFRYTLWLSFLEVYQDKVYDLLEDISENKPYLKFGMDPISKLIHVKGVKYYCASSWEEAWNLYLFGLSRLVIKGTNLNSQSSRSHCIFRLNLVAKSSTHCFSSSLSVCDLAGSERHNKAMNSFERVKESLSINSSLSVLHRCLDIIRKNQRTTQKKIVPFRESKLTSLFQEYFVKGANITMLIHLSQDSYVLEENLFALKISALSQKIVLSKELISQNQLEGFPMVTRDNLMPLQEENEKLKQEIKSLQSALEEASTSSNIMKVGGASGEMVSCKNDDHLKALELVEKLQMEKLKTEKLKNELKWKNRSIDLLKHRINTCSAPEIYKILIKNMLDGNVKETTIDSNNEISRLLRLKQTYEFLLKTAKSNISDRDKVISELKLKIQFYEDTYLNKSVTTFVQEDETIAPPQSSETNRFFPVQSSTPTDSMNSSTSSSEGESEVEFTTESNYTVSNLEAISGVAELKLSSSMEKLDKSQAVEEQKYLRRSISLTNILEFKPAAIIITEPTPEQQTDDEESICRVQMTRRKPRFALKKSSKKRSDLDYEEQPNRQASAESSSDQEYVPVLSKAPKCTIRKRGKSSKKMVQENDYLVAISNAGCSTQSASESGPVTRSRRKLFSGDGSDQLLQSFGELTVKSPDTSPLRELKRHQRKK